ncbi:hypothetical protein [Litoreibacter arenae]|uniref:Peptidase M43 pregnancy-associated plasma-A domain-containing protein n=1 Tax=Litoreibacter arenae DSM 19593 TaxID=1123360 RepID=S9QFD4_9RHOB|nr:hypothetical protein [Litoreibacter arenae]EPX80116.1 hypothetical protein thalar_01454 [Litoreibacter arenae DSM 19593]
MRVFALLAAILLVAPATAQTVQERAFRLLSTESNVEQSCGFQVRSSLAGTMTRLGYQLRLPNWSLGVAQITGMGITNAGVDTTLDLAADLLKSDLGANDVNCCVDLNRNGNIINFAPPASMVGGIITTQAESNAVFAVNADIKVVNGIQFCGVSAVPPSTFVGCADGNSIITINTFNPPAVNVFTDPATVAHEVGHWAGLDHVGQTCSPTPGQCGDCDCTDGFIDRVMFCSICNGAPAQGLITAQQCTSYQDAAQ